MRRFTVREQSNPEMLRRVRELRQEMTPEEAILWEELRGNALGVNFRRQQPLGSYIVDFYSHRAVELDGSPHIGQQGYDAMRDRFLERAGVRVLRFPNSRVRNDLPALLEAIRGALRQP